MPAPQWRHHASLIARLLERPRQFQFFQAVRVIELWLRRGAPAHGRTLDTVLRFKNSVSLAFPASQIEALEVAADRPVRGDAALQEALVQGRLRHIRLTPAFMGFLGVKGVLPYDYTDTIAAQIHFDKNEGGRAFFDTFSHRAMTLFYRAWEKSRVEYRRDDKGGDGFLPLQLALAGRIPDQAGAPAARPAGDAIADEVVARYAALLRHRPMPVESLADLLSDYFGVPFRLEPFVGGWEQLRPDERSRIGVHHCQLGVNTMLGSRYWRRELCARLWIGPLARADFERFLAIGSGAKALKKLLALFAVPTVRFEVRPVLRAQDVKPVVLDRSARLGYGSFLLCKPPPADQDRHRYIITF